MAWAPARPASPEQHAPRQERQVSRQRAPQPPVSEELGARQQDPPSVSAHLPATVERGILFRPA